MKPNSFFLRVWRWHFYAGLFALPFLLTLACTGIVYLFRFELEDFLYRNRLFVQTASKPLSLEEQRASAENFLKEGTLKSVVPPASAERSTSFLFTTPQGEDVTVFVNPADGLVLGTREETVRPSALALKIHGNLLVGTMGDLLMELAASWAILLVISGLYLWFPRASASKVWGVLLPRLTLKNSRLPWRDLHAVSGFWVAGVLGFFAFTGLFWSGFWGEKFAKPWSTFPAQMWDDVPKSNVTNATLNTENTKVVPWAVENLPVPLSTHHETAAEQNGNPTTDTTDPSHAGHSRAVPKSQTHLDKRWSLDSIQKLATVKGLLPNRTIALPQGPEGVFTVSAVAENPQDEAILHVDQYSGEVLADIRYDHYSPVAKAVATSIALHEGRYFGLANKILALIGCLLVILLCVSAMVLWWRRRPSLSNFRAPSRTVLPRHWLGASAVVCVFALAFPAAGVSLALVLLLDFFVLNRVHIFKRMF